MKFKKNTFIQILIITSLCFCIFIVLRNECKFEALQNKKGLWCILLTTCVNSSNDVDQNQDRKKLYTKQIARWLNETDLHIFVVESSGHSFDEFKNNDKFTMLTFTQGVTHSSSVGEYNSFKYALSRLKNDKIFEPYTNILKVTGRYFLSDIEKILNDIDIDNDLLLQIHRDNKKQFQNSEYFGIKKKLLFSFIESFKIDDLMETNLYNFSLDKKWVTIGPFKNDVARGGDKIILQELFTN